MSRPASWGWERWPRRKTLDGATWLCRWCAKPLGRGLTAYCSRECEHEIYVRCMWTSLSRAIFERDKGICRGCGVNLEDLETFFGWYDKTYRKYREIGKDGPVGYYGASVVWEQKWPFPDVLKRDLGYRDHLWETNHKVGISEGGDPVDPENLETLCIPCHAKHTAALKRRLAKAKKSGSTSAKNADQSGNVEADPACKTK